MPPKKRHRGKVSTFDISSFKFPAINRSDFIPRSSRLKRGTGNHHTMLRGINRSNIFEGDQDKTFFKFKDAGKSTRGLSRALDIGRSIVERAVKI